MFETTEKRSFLKNNLPNTVNNISHQGKSYFHSKKEIRLDIKPIIGPKPNQHVIHRQSLNGLQGLQDVAMSKVCHFTQTKECNNY